MNAPFVPPALTPLADLTQGLDKLTADGWTQNAYEDDNGCCASGALQDRDCSAGMPYLRDAILATGWEGEDPDLNVSDPCDWGYASVVIRWNDQKGRTWPEVKAIYEAAIELAAAELELVEVPA